MSVYKPNSSKRMTASFIPNTILSSQLSRAVLLIGIVLSFIHMTGILISVYYLVDRLMEPGKHHEKEILKRHKSKQFPDLS